MGSALSAVLFNVYTVGITSNQLEAPGKTLSFADDVLVYRHGKDREEIARSAQEELDRLGEWCVEFKGRIHPDKAGVLWCSLNNHAVKPVRPAVYMEGKELKREQRVSLLTEVCHWCVGILVCGYTGVLIYWCVDILMCGYTGVWIYWCVDILVCGYTGV